MQYKNWNMACFFIIDNTTLDANCQPVLWCLDTDHIRSARCWHVTTVLEQLRSNATLRWYAHTHAGAICIIAQCDPDRLCCVRAAGLRWCCSPAKSTSLLRRAWHYSVTWTYVIVPQCLSVWSPGGSAQWEAVWMHFVWEFESELPWEALLTRSHNRCHLHWRVWVPFTFEPILDFVQKSFLFSKHYGM